MGRAKKCIGEPRKPSKKWDDLEQINVLMYMKEIVSKGLEIEKPNAKIFYERMILNLKMKDLTVNQLMYKVGKIKDTYTEAVKWEKSTGVGIRNGSIKEHLRTICEHFDLLEEIYGGKANVNPSYVYQSGSNVSGGIAHTYGDFDPYSPKESDPHPDSIAYERLYDEFFNNSTATTSTAIATNTFATTGTSLITTTAATMSSAAISSLVPTAGTPLITTSTAATISSAVMSNPAATSIITNPVATTSTVATNCTNSEKRSRSESPEDTVSRFRKPLSTIPVNKAVKPRKTESTAATLMADWQCKRVEAIAEKTKILCEKNKQDDKWKASELKLAEDKFKFEKKYRLKELELKKMEIQKEENLKKLEMEKNERLDALKMEYEFKLQVGRTNNI